MQICVQEPSGRGERESAAAHAEARRLNPSQLILWDHLRGAGAYAQRAGRSLAAILLSQIKEIKSVLHE